MRKYTVRSRKFYRSYLEALVITLAIGFILRSYVIAPYKIPTDSMSPALMSGDYIFVFKLPYGAHIPFWGKIGEVKNLKRGDIVLFSYSRDPDTRFIKRVIGLPGDRIELKDIDPLVVPEDEVFLVSDHRDSTDDSRYWGMVPTKNLYGKAFAIWFSVDPDTSRVRWNRLFSGI